METNDPKLKEAMAEVRAILRKHDIAGAIILTSETHSEFGLEITPSWSAFSWETTDKGEGIRLRAKSSEIGKEKAHRLVSGSVHITKHVQDLSARFFMQFRELMKVIETHVEVEYVGDAHITPHVEH